MPMKYIRQGMCSINSKAFNDNDNGNNGNNGDDNETTSVVWVEGC